MSFATPWRKLFRDIRAERGRMLLLLLAVTIGVFTVSTMLGAYGIVSREIGANYRQTNPAHATIETDGVTPAVLAAARAFPGVAAAEARAVVEGRVEIGEDWVRLLLFVVDDFEGMQLNTFKLESGAWPPPTGSMLVERQAAALLGAGEGASVTVRTPHGAPREVAIAGIVHDTTLAPAWQEQTAYGYLTLATLAGLGEPPVLNELRILFADGGADIAAIDAAALALADRLRQDGVAVESIKVPPPGEHPHQGQMLASLRMFVAFSALGLLLSAILVAAVLAATLARQVRAIGIMKAVGARSGQIALIYGSGLLLLGAAAVAIGLPIGSFAAVRLAGLMAEVMNFSVTDPAIPLWVDGIVAGAGLLLPLLVSVPAILRASRLTVREALADRGINLAFGSGRFERGLAAIGGLALPTLFALRNMFRRRLRLVLALTLLAVGGGIFIAALSVRDGWRAMADHVLADRRDDATFLFTEPVERGRIDEALAAVDGLGSIEAWGYNQTAFAAAGRIDVMRTYPDRGHGSFALFGVPPETEMIRLPVLEGRWLEPGDSDAVVLSQTLFQQIPGARIGDPVLLSIEGRPTEWRLAGVVLEVGGRGAYVSAAGYARASGRPGTASALLVSASPGTGRSADEVARAVERALDDAGLPVERSMPLTRLHEAMVGHVEVPVGMLVSAAVLLAVIGGLGLAAMTAIGVLERTREIGIIKAVGGLPSLVRRLVMTEAALIAAASWVFAILVALPLIKAIGLLGARMFGMPLPFSVSPFAAVFWLLLVLAIAVLASAAPGARAARLPVRQALAYE